MPPELPSKLEEQSERENACELLADVIRSDEAERLYLCVWGDGYANPGEPAIALRQLDFFTEEEGYRERDRDAIDNLAFGESTTIVGLADVQSVIRVR